MAIFQHHGRCPQSHKRPVPARTQKRMGQMGKSKRKSDSPFLGRWHIVSMSTWDKDYCNEEVQAYLEFDAKGSGSFQFGYVQGNLDCQLTTRCEEPAVEWTWDGSDGADGTHMTGRGWAVLQGGE